MGSKKPLTINEEVIAGLAAKLVASRKYRQLAIPQDTILDLITKAGAVHTSPDEIEDTVRRKLHNLVAPYLGDPDYSRLCTQLPNLPRDLQSPEVLQFCLNILNAHASTRERVPINEDFYQRIFALTGVPKTIYDLACGVNPFALPWMHLPSVTRYVACDLHLPRIELINTFFDHVGQSGRALQEDILVNPPAEAADVIFFFKEAHRFEQRESGSVHRFLQQLQADWILLSLPTETLTGRRSMLDQDRRLVAAASAGLSWQVEELLFPTEIVFCIRKGS